MSEPVSITEPFIGPRPFDGSDEDRARFFGRERETIEVSSLILAQQKVLLYAASGAGKTSLLHAAVIPRLQARDVRVLPVARLQAGANEDLDGAENPFVARILATTGLEAPSTGRLNEALGRRRAEHRAPALTLLVLDQFEELFTLPVPNPVEHRRDLFEQIEQAIEDDPLLRIVYSIREDFLANIDPYLALYEQGSRARFRLRRLGPAAAVDAIEKPLDLVGWDLEPGVSQMMVADLARNVIVDADGVPRTVPGEFVEPVQLQVVCLHLWNNRPSGTTTFTEAQRNELANADQALGRFFDRGVEAATAAGWREGRVGRQVDKAAKASGWREYLVRRWVKKDLITSLNTRAPVVRENGTKEAVWIDAMDRANILRRQDRSDASWYEITHDRLIGPIQQSNETSTEERNRSLGWAALMIAVVGLAAFLFVGKQWRDAEQVVTGLEESVGDLQDSQDRIDRYGERLEDGDDGLTAEQARLVNCIRQEATGTVTEQNQCQLEPSPTAIATPTPSPTTTEPPPATPSPVPTTEPSPTPTPTPCATPEGATDDEVCVVGPVVCPELGSPAPGEELGEEVWSFSWGACEDALAYHLRITDPLGEARVVRTAELAHDHPVPDSAATNPGTWTWTVRSVFRNGPGAWPPERPFTVSSQECAPELRYPTSETLLDNLDPETDAETVWIFDWEPCPDVESYRLTVEHPSEPSRRIEVLSRGKTIHPYSLLDRIPENALTGWTWTVTAIGGGATSGVFGVNPLPPDPACIPRPVEPTANRVLDNGDPAVGDPIIWEFEWEPCDDAESYELLVWHPDEDALRVPTSEGEQEIPGTSFTYTGDDQIPSDRLAGWIWTVRAKVDGVFGKPAVSGFRVEPPPVRPPPCQPDGVPTLEEPPELERVSNASDATTTWEFGWSCPGGADRYDIRIIDPAGVVVTKATTADTEFTYRVDAVVPEGVWSWQVRATEAGRPSTDWVTGRFIVGPPEGPVCTLLQPPEDDLLDNYVEPATTWSFDWECTLDPDGYQIVITDPDLEVFRDDSPITSEYSTDLAGAVTPGVWTWQVQASVDGDPGAWSRGRFRVRSVNGGPEPPCRPSSLMPPNGHVFDNYKPPPAETEWRFEWACDPVADAYRIVIRRPGGALYRLSTVTDLSYVHPLDEVIFDRFGWTWRVAAIENDVPGPWSDLKIFNVAPVNGGPEPPCRPSSLMPPNGHEFDNYKPPAVTEWKFEWSCSGDADDYRLVVRKPDDSIYIDKTVTDLFHIHVLDEEIDDLERLGWTWSVEARLGSKRETSLTRTVDVKPVPPDPGPCVPVLSSPPDGHEFDNYKPPAVTEWKFEWSCSGDADDYRLVVRKPDDSIYIDKTVTDLFHIHVLDEEIDDLERLGWTWSVEARLGSKRETSLTRTVDVKPVPPDPGPCVPVLSSPPDGHEFDNYKPPAVTEWKFEWSCSGDADDYRLVVRKPDDSIYIDKTVTDLFSIHVLDEEIGDFERLGWTWSVEARLGSKGETSLTRTFDVKALPCEPTLVSPAAGAVLPNHDPPPSTTWIFDWSCVPEADLYQIVVTRPGGAIYFDATTTTTQYSHTLTSELTDDQRASSWSWRVRARTDGVWTSHTPPRSFNVATRRAYIEVGTDDVEQRPSGPMEVGILQPNSNDVDFSRGPDPSHTEGYTIGLRYHVCIPVGAVVQSAKLTFTADEPDGAPPDGNPTEASIWGHLVADAPTFEDEPDLRARTPRTSAVDWSPIPVFVPGFTYDTTSNLAPIIDEIVGLPTWTGCGYMVLFLEGSGNGVKSLDPERRDGDREAVAFENTERPGRDHAPRLTLSLQDS